MISFTDQQLAQLTESEKTMYEAYCGIAAMLGWIDSGKTKASSAFLEAQHQCLIAQFLLEHALDRPMVGRTQKP